MRRNAAFRDCTTELVPVYVYDDVRGYDVRGFKEWGTTCLTSPRQDKMGLVPVYDAPWDKFEEISYVLNVRRVVRSAFHFAETSANYVIDAVRVSFFPREVERGACRPCRDRSGLSSLLVQCLPPQWMYVLGQELEMEDPRVGQVGPLRCKGVWFFASSGGLFLEDLV